MSTGRREQDPAQRVLQAAVEALKKRNLNSKRGQASQRALWLRANWPTTFVIDKHRNRLVQEVIDDDELRSEIRHSLGKGVLSAAIGQSFEDDLDEALQRAEDPYAAFINAATHPDKQIACLSAAYLLNERSVPVPLVTQPLTGQPVGASMDRSSAQRADHVAPQSQLDETRRQLRRAERRARAAESELENLRNQLERAREETVATRRELAELGAKLPTRKQQRALSNAEQIQAELKRAKRALSRSINERDNLFHQLRTDLARAHEENAQLRESLDAEQRGRRRLSNELGDSTERARRLLILVNQEIQALDKAVVDERPGPGRTKMRKRRDQLADLARLLQNLFGVNGSPRETQQTAASPRPSTAQVDVLSERQSMKVTPLGGNDHIGGSALLVESGDTRILVDAGLRPNAHLSNPGPRRIADAVSGRIDAIVITHAHADHAGFVPWVLERQRRAQIVCTPETAALLPTVWADSVRVMRAEADATSRPGEHEEPPYGEAEVMQAEEAIQELACGRTRTVRDVALTLFPAGHVLGAAGVVVRAGERRVVITGDIDDRAQGTVGAARIPPRLAAEADLLVIETTYCDSEHRDRTHEASNLVRTAEDVLATGGRVLVPAFGLGRAQEIALLVSKHLPDVPVRIDGLARDISEIYEHEGAPTIFGGQVTRVANRHRDIMGFRQGIVITTSGMLTGGAAVPWARSILQEPESALFLCGHQDEEAPGKQLERLLDSDPSVAREIELRDPTTQKLDIVPVLSKVLRYNLSAHADRSGLLDIIDEANPKAIMLVHGVPGRQREFKRRLEAAGRVVVDNTSPWDSESPQVDSRRARWRHPARHPRRAGAQ